MTPRIKSLSSPTSTATSLDDCQGPCTKAAASLGREITTPGERTVACTSTVLSRVASFTLGWVRGGKGFKSTIKTSKLVSPQRTIKPARPISDWDAFAICIIETASGPPVGFGVRTNRHVPELSASGSLR